MLGILGSAWAAYSFAATLIGATGVLAVVMAFVLTPYLPAGIRHAMFFGGALVLGCAVYGQFEHSRGAAAQVALDHARALAAEQSRTAAARRVNDALAVQATRDIAAAQADNAHLKDLLDDAQKRADAGRTCLPRDLSRRLRNL